MQPPDLDRPLLLDAPRLPVFPVEALPQPLREMCEAVALETETPVDLAAMLGLAIIGAACSRRLEVESRNGHVEPLNVYTLVVLPSGNRKTAVFRQMSAPLEAFERELQISVGPEIAAARATRDAEEKSLEALKRKAAGSGGDAKRQLLAELGGLAADLEGRPVPTMPRLIVNDVTSEKLGLVLSEQGGRIAVLDDEGGLFDTMGGRYSKSGVANIDVWLKGHDGGDLRVQRLGRADFSVTGIAITLSMVVQPDVLRGLVAKPGFLGRGLLARILYALPASRVGTRNLDTPVTSPETASAYARMVRALLKRPDGLEKPLRLMVSADAHADWLAFARSLESRRGPRGDLAHLADWASKLEGAVARIAALLHAAENPSDPSCTDITASVMKRAIQIGQYLIEHARAAFDEMGLDIVTDRARRLIDWLRQKNRISFSRRDVLRANAAGCQRRADLDPVLELLEDRGLIQRELNVASPTGGRPRGPVYLVAAEVLG
jgi:replicative DNA helicase